MAAAAAARQRLRILCFGDSLTEGYSSLGTVFHSYNEKMSQMIQMAFPDRQITTEVDGLSGDTIWHGFLDRMKLHFPESNSNTDSNNNNNNNNNKKDGEGTSPYDWAIVLGGTNDIAWGIPVDDIFRKLTEIWDIPLSRGCKVLALTIPEAAISGKAKERTDMRRNKLNDLIKGYKKDNFHVYDLHAAVPYHAMSPADQQKYWDDHVHFTPKGYDLIGNKVGMALVSVMVKQRVADLPPAKRRRVFKNDDKMFDEETGDPHAIDQGYVVVRRIDLD